MGQAVRIMLSGTQKTPVYTYNSKVSVCTMTPWYRWLQYCVIAMAVNRGIPNPVILEYFTVPKCQNWADEILGFCELKITVNYQKIILT